MRLIEACTSLLAPDGSMWLNVGSTSCKIVWHYKAGVACKKYFSPREKLLWYVKDQITSLTLTRFAILTIRGRAPAVHERRERCNPKGKIRQTFGPSPASLLEGIDRRKRGRLILRISRAHEKCILFRRMSAM